MNRSKCLIVEFSVKSEMVPLPYASTEQVAWATVTTEWRGTSASSQQTFANRIILRPTV